MSHTISFADLMAFLTAVPQSIRIVEQIAIAQRRIRECHRIIAKEWQMAPAGGYRVLPEACKRLSLEINCLKNRIARLEHVLRSGGPTPVRNLK